MLTRSKAKKLNIQPETGLQTTIRKLAGRTVLTSSSKRARHTPLKCNHVTLDDTSHDNTQFQKNAENKDEEQAEGSKAEPKQAALRSGPDRHDDELKQMDARRGQTVESQDVETEPKDLATQGESGQIGPSASALTIGGNARVDHVNIYGSIAVGAGEGSSVQQHTGSGAIPKSKGDRPESSVQQQAESEAIPKSIAHMPDRIDLTGSICYFPKRKISKQVYHGEQTTATGVPRRIAVKTEFYDKNTLKETKILLKLGPHQNVISYIDSGTYHRGEIMFLAMELCHEQNLRQYTEARKRSDEPFHQNLAIKHAKQIVAGLAHIHDSKILHRDLKPDNILFSLNRKNLKICDFGLSKDVGKQSISSPSSGQAGTDGYQAPEVILKGESSEKADIFSLGLVLHYIWSDGRHPFGSDPADWNLHIKMNLRRNFTGLKLKPMAGTIDFLSWMLQFEPKDRPALREVEDNAILGGYGASPLYLAEGAAGFKVETFRVQGVTLSEMRVEDTMSSVTGIKKPPNQSSIKSIDSGVEIERPTSRMFHEKGGASNELQTVSTYSFDKLPEYALHAELALTWEPKGVLNYYAKSLSSGKVISAKESSAILPGIEPGDEYSVTVYEKIEGSPDVLVAKSEIQTRKTIRREGGIVTVGGCVLEFPSNAIRDEAAIEVCSNLKDAPYLPDECFRITPVFDFRSTQKIFGERVTCILTAPYINIAKPTKVAILRYENQTWQKICSSYLMMNKTIKFECDHFSPHVAVLEMSFEDIRAQDLSISMATRIYCDAKNNFNGVTCLNDPSVIGECDSLLQGHRYSPSAFILRPIDMKVGETVNYVLRNLRPIHEVINEWEVTLDQEFIKNWYFLEPFCMDEPSKERQCVKLQLELTHRQKSTRYNINHGIDRPTPRSALITAMNVVQLQGQTIIAQAGGERTVISYQHTQQISSAEFRPLNNETGP